MEALDGIPLLSDWATSYRDLHFATGVGNRSAAAVSTRQYSFNSPGFGGVEARSILDLDTGRPALFAVQFTCIVHSRTSNILLGPVPAYIQSVWFSRFSFVIEGLVVFAVLLWIAGREDRPVIWKTIRLPEPMYAGLALVIPIGIGVLLTTGQYLFDRAQCGRHTTLEAWICHNSVPISPSPIPSSFFSYQRFSRK